MTAARERRAVVVTGVGAVTPLGLGAERLLSAWVEGVCGIRDGVGSCAEFDPLAELPLRDVRRTDRATQLVLVAAGEALEQAGWDGAPPVEPCRAGCVVGTGLGGIGSAEEQTAVRLERGEKKVSPFTIPNVMANASAAAIAIRHALRGPAFSIAAACAAGGQAIGTAVRLIESGEVDAAVAGGTEAPLTPTARAAFHNMGATSRSGTSRPFDARRDGFVLSEGAAALVLEAAEVAERRGARPLGRVAGYGATVDAYHLTAPEPSGESCARAIALALEDAGAAPGELAYVNAHGTSTELNDRIETDALKAALGADARRVPVSSTKSAIGHTLGAAGAIEAVATLLALRARVAPPTLGYEQPDDGLDLDYVPGAARPLETAARSEALALSNSFGFGGHNTVLCLAA